MCLLIVCASVRLSGAGGIPEPGITMYGQVLADDQSLVTDGQLTWTYSCTEVGHAFTVAVTTDLIPFNDDSGTTYSYRIHIPCEMPVPGKTSSANRLPAGEEALTYTRNATLDSAATTIFSGAESTYFGYADRGRVERVDLVTGIHGPPDPPSMPNPPDGATLVAAGTALDWADSARAETYDIYLWNAAFAKPAAPAAAGLTASDFQPAVALRPDTDYVWQVVAYNAKGSTPGPHWVFRTAFQGDLQILLDYLLGKRDLTFEQYTLFDLNHDGTIDIADLVLGLKRTPYLAPARENASEVVRAVRIDTVCAPGTRISQVAVPVSLWPYCTDVAGINMHIEFDPTVLQVVGVEPKHPAANEDLHFHCPSPGVLNVVLFSNPVRPLTAPDPNVLVVAVEADPPALGATSHLELGIAAISDLDGLSFSNVGKRDGCIHFLGSETVSSRWELYR